jgi:hypothetical protein
VQRPKEERQQFVKNEDVQLLSVERVPSEKSEGAHQRGDIQLNEKDGQFDVANLPDAEQLRGYEKREQFEESKSEESKSEESGFEESAFESIRRNGGRIIAQSNDAKRRLLKENETCG